MSLIPHVADILFSHIYPKKIILKIKYFIVGLDENMCVCIVWPSGLTKQQSNNPFRLHAYKRNAWFKSLVLKFRSEPFAWWCQWTFLWGILNKKLETKCSMHSDALFLYYFIWADTKTKMLSHKIMMSWHLVHRASHSIDNIIGSVNLQNI